MRRGRAGFLLNATLSVSLIVLIAAVALVVKPPSPPGIAEFAPQAARPITKAPLNQSSANGTAAACVGDGTCAATEPKPKPQVSLPPVGAVLKGVPSALQCYTWPDGSVTQTFDPQSPPCVANWPEADKGNGGATTQGVTGSEIRIAVPTTAKSSTFPQIKAVANFINSHYELYGRKLTLVPFTSMTSGQDVDHASNPSYEHADAVSAAALKPFAATEFVDRNDYVAVMPEYVDYLADHHVVTTFGSNQTTGIEESSMREHAPYQWSYTSTLTDSLVSLAGLACRTLKGKPAIHAKGGLQTKTRKFGIVLPDQHMMGQPLTGFNRFISALAGCGLSDLPIYYDTKDARQATNAANMADAKNKGITTLLWFQWSSSTDDPQAMADQARYSPEWVAVSRNFWWSASWALLGNNQTGNTMGISPFSKLLIDSQQFWMQAYQAGGGPLPPPGQIDGAAPLYRDLQLLASGIQMAGPRLTPETLAAALHGIDYPNPGAGAAPYYQARVGFQGGSPVMTHDFVAYWPDPSGTKSQFLVDNTYNNPYEFYCWVNDGARYTADTWPAEDRFHKGRCR